MIGTYGPVTFEASSEAVRTFTGMRRSLEGRWATHETVDGAPLLEFLGPGLDRLNFAMTFNSALGVDPLTEANRLREMVRAGVQHVLIVGGLPVGRYAIKSVSDSWGHVDGGGRVLTASVTVNLEQYEQGAINGA